MRRPLAGDRLTALGRRLGRGVLLGLLALLGACQDRAPVVLAQFRALGTQFEVRLVGATPDQVERARGIIAQALGVLEHEWSPQGENMQRVNQLLSRGETFVPPPSVLRLIRLGQIIESETEGLVNLGNGGLTRLWGFAGEPAANQHPPSQRQLDAWVRHVPSLRAIESDGLRVRSSDPNLLLDLAPIVRAQAIDLVIHRLKGLGMRHVLVQTPYEQRALGERSGQPWRVPILHPGGSSVLAILPLRGDEALATVSEYDRSFIDRGQRYHDLLDPRTGQPARGLRLVAVLDQEATRATVVARALFIAGPRDWQRLALDLGTHRVLLIDAGGQVWVSPRLAERLEPLDPSAAVTIVDPVAP
ncbi:FAD:protein FMN transferase [Caldichromatium japonicum]|uniref:FAD:protein FMN transferase n=1 Tax=Caldichromatium japonicum TaxID=2699430 RepID=A0A6G7VFV2_9GAMM|nr:FAD:protein FMN transferase [Caldichromatium japonicum]QIK38756.1 FAD:protein FMN transferase [Caldichromatium japonicum]